MALLKTRLPFSLLLLLAALTAGACHRKRTPPTPAVALPMGHAGAEVRPASARKPPRRPFATASATPWLPESQTRPPDRPRPTPEPQPSAAGTTVYDTSPGRLPMWRQRAKNY